MTTLGEPVLAPLGHSSAQFSAQPPLTILFSKKVDVLRDAVAQQTTPHEVYCASKTLDGLATVPLGPMGVSHKTSDTTEYRAQGFLLSATQDTIMRPDPEKGALVLAVDSAEIAQQAQKVLGHDHHFGQFQWLNRQTLVESSLTQMCTGAWEMAMSLPVDTQNLLSADS